MLPQLCACLALVALTSAALMPGAPVASADLQYLDTAVKGVRSYFQAERNTLPDSIRLVGATTQVVAGIRYEFHFLVSSPNDQVDLCSTSLWVRPWLSEDYVTQMDDPIKCGVPDSVIDSLETAFNARSNDLFYAKINTKPSITVEGSDIKLVDVPLSATSCTHQDISDGKSCEVADDAKPKYKVSARLVWSNSDFSFADFTYGSFSG